ncbi:hypothetical protein C8259_03395 [Nocardia nova]|uniref:Uncharacterized protein n=2 Tax=Nocardia TaxID=1817 RepID=A0A2T2ZBT1_9NOCA|nr:hypothetical protein [Nocardia nova]PSR65221.1 hypothetical protein C8259_03395 [Nocardia nova]
MASLRAGDFVFGPVDLFERRLEIGQTPRYRRCDISDTSSWLSVTTDSYRWMKEANRYSSVGWLARRDSLPISMPAEEAMNAGAASALHAENVWCSCALDASEYWDLAHLEGSRAAV